MFILGAVLVASGFAGIRLGIWVANKGATDGITVATGFLIKISGYMWTFVGGFVLLAALFSALGFSLP